jgi:hypothetical protein
MVYDVYMGTPTTTITTKSATEAAALSGFQLECECGLRWSTSLSRPMAENEAKAHQAWHRKAGR